MNNEVPNSPNSPDGSSHSLPNRPIVPPPLHHSMRSADSKSSDQVHCQNPFDSAANTLNTSFQQHVKVHLKGAETFVVDHRIPLAGASGAVTTGGACYVWQKD